MEGKPKRPKRHRVLGEILTQFDSEKSRWRVQAAKWEDPSSGDSEPCVCVFQRRLFGPNGMSDKEFSMSFTSDELLSVMQGLRSWMALMEGASRVA